MDGVELLRAIRSHDPAPIAVALGDDRRFEHALEAIRAGASDYVAKSAAPEELLRRVRDAVALDRANRTKRFPSERVLAIGAHPDDVELSCGGILLRHRDAGHSITILTLTSGEASGTAAVRRSESHRAAALLPRERAWRSTSAGDARLHARCAYFSKREFRSCSAPTATRRTRSGVTRTASRSSSSSRSGAAHDRGASHRADRDGHVRGHGGGRRVPSVRSRGGARTATAVRTGHRAPPSRRRGDPGLERGSGLRAHDRLPDGDALSPRASSRIRRRRREHRSDAANHHGVGRPSPGRGGQPTSRQRRDGQGRRNQLWPEANPAGMA
jgi:GlcNAc-PI de-N-acetylase